MDWLTIIVRTSPGPSKNKSTIVLVLVRELFFPYIKTRFGGGMTVFNIALKKDGTTNIEL